MESGEIVSSGSTNLVSTSKNALKLKVAEKLAFRTSGTITVVKRSGSLVPFRKDRVLSAIEAAFRDVKQIPASSPLPQEVYSAVQAVSNQVVEEVKLRAAGKPSLTVEEIQDIVELKLMQGEFYDVAKGYIIYRDERKAQRDDSPQNLKLLRRDGTTLVKFNPIKIATAIEKAFRATHQIEGDTPEVLVEAVNLLTNKVVARAAEIAKEGTQLHVELIQDEVERQMMAAGYYQVAKDFIIYRASRAAARAHEALVTSTHEALAPAAQPTEVATQPELIEDPGRNFKVTLADGSQQNITELEIRKRIQFACKGLETVVSAEEILTGSIISFYEGIKAEEVDSSNILSARSRIEKDPAYSNVAARLLLDVIYRETMGVSAHDPKLTKTHQAYVREYFKQAVTHGRVDPKLLEFDLDKIAKALDLSRDFEFTYLGLQTLYDRYLIHHKDRRLETPQIFWMRVAMGLSILEGDQKTERAIEFYEILSKFLFTSSTPTLFNSGTLHSQMSSCYLSTTYDDLGHIFKVISDDAQLSKWAGGLGNDWTYVRATGSHIKGTNGRSQGIIPFLKVANDTAVAVNQGGKRKGAMCAYLETWHLDIEDFLELRKNTGDERRRTHDMNTANWIPDLFMKRVAENKMWTLFSPSDAPDLHDLYGKAFEKRYEQYEAMVDNGEMKLFKRVEAVALWRKMLGMVFETGHPWITFKDPSNLRSPQSHCGVVHSSNLCTEILLNTSKEETAVCNLGSINLVTHTTAKGIDKELLAKTVKVAVRMLDNVIDINFYPTAEAKTSNMRHRPIGLGFMGFQDALYVQGISYASPEAVQFADESMELISYYAILASTELAKERGKYSSYKGSKWDQGLLPIDTVRLVADERGAEYCDMDTGTKLDWSIVRDAVKKNGMRNSNTMAIAPTATISNIVDATQSIEPAYKHLYAKSNLSGDFIVHNKFLVEELKKRDLWDAEMIDDLKYFDGSIAEIERIPADLKKVYLTAFEIEPEWIIECGSRRQKWIDMGQSLNLYMAQPSGKKLSDMYLLAWKKGLKTTYYLRSLGATQVEKSTTDVNKRGLQPRWMKNKSASANIKVDRTDGGDAPAPQATAHGATVVPPLSSDIKSDMPRAVCGLDGSCESCQ